VSIDLRQHDIVIEAISRRSDKLVDCYIRHWVVPYGESGLTKVESREVDLIESRTVDDIQIEQSAAVSAERKLIDKHSYLSKLEDPCVVFNRTSRSNHFHWWSMRFQWNSKLLILTQLLGNSKHIYKEPTKRFSSSFTIRLIKVVRRHTVTWMTAFWLVSWANAQLILPTTVPVKSSYVEFLV